RWSIVSFVGRLHGRSARVDRNAQPADWNWRPPVDVGSLLAACRRAPPSPHQPAVRTVRGPRASRVLAWASRPSRLDQAGGDAGYTVRKVSPASPPACAG